MHYFLGKAAKIAAALASGG